MLDVVPLDAAPRPSAVVSMLPHCHCHNYTVMHHQCHTLRVLVSPLPLQPRSAEERGAAEAASAAADKAARLAVVEELLWGSPLVRQAAAAQQPSRWNPAGAHGGWFGGRGGEVAAAACCTGAFVCSYLTSCNSFCALQVGCWAGCRPRPCSACWAWLCSWCGWRLQTSRCAMFRCAGQLLPLGGWGGCWLLLNVVLTLLGCCNPAHS